MLKFPGTSRTPTVVDNNEFFFLLKTSATTFEAVGCCMLGGVALPPCMGRARGIPQALYVLPPFAHSALHEVGCIYKGRVGASGPTLPPNYTAVWAVAMTPILVIYEDIR